MIITFGGRAGTGTTSVGKALAKKLGYKFYYAGGVRRELANKRGITLAELNKQGLTDPYSDKLVDDYMKEMAKNQDNFIVDGWLAFYCIPQSVKVCLKADSKVRAKRIFERGDKEEKPSSEEEALNIITERENNSARRYDKLYGIDPFNESQFDLVVDTSNNTVEQTMNIIYDFIKDKLKK